MNYKKPSLPILSLCLICGTAILEFRSVPGVFFSSGYLIALLLAARTGSRGDTILVMGFSLVCIYLPFSYQTAISFEILLYSRIYTSVGALITTSLILKYLSDLSKASAQRELMEGVFSYGTQSILLAEEDGRIAFVNPFTEILFQYDKGTIAGKFLKELSSDIDSNELSAHPSGSTGVRFDAIGIRKSGAPFPIEITINTFDSDGRRYLVAFIIDITHRVAQEEKLHVQKRTLEDVNAELEAFSYSVSHDLRAPLRAVSGYAKMLEEDAGDRLDDEGKRLLLVIQESAKKMGLLIDELLEFSRLGRKGISKTIVDMQVSAEDSLYELIKSTGQKARVTIHPLLPASADAALIKHVWTNLLSNAIKYSSKSANPTVIVKSTELDGKVIYSIEDNGAGFDMKYSHKLFGVFQRLHSSEEFEGTGVGLATAQRIVEKHGGKIWAEGHVGHGATFYFQL